jgi:two-component system phosphate regulon sensor histidine kinase PhoR
MLVEDITQARRLEQMRRDFVANVSHELRTPLTVINGYLETFIDSGDDCCLPWRQPMRRMHEQTERMLHLIEDLLILSRLETEGAQRPEHPVPVPELLHSVAEDALGLSGQRGHKIRVEADSELWLRGSEPELRSAFSNLIFNAVRHTPDRGEIVIRWYANEAGLHLEVEDDGEGIPATHIPRLTERFYRVDRGRARSHGGTGLGLAIVKHVLNRHEGRLRINSQVGVGSIFSCDFPAQRRLKRQLASAANP